VGGGYECGKEKPSNEEKRAQLEIPGRIKIATNGCSYSRSGHKKNTCSSTHDQLIYSLPQE
jgi:hypothetical protein